MEITLNDLKQLIGSPSNTHSFVVGRCYFLRCVTFYYTGRLVSVTDTDIVLEEAAWIASTGRFHNCLKSGQFDEVEPFTESVIIPRGAIVDASLWNHKLPQEQK